MIYETIHKNNEIKDQQSEIKQYYMKLYEKIIDGKYIATVK